ncbi:indole-3-glycerol phosphate synthase TrpC [Blastomonas fulva]|uniref:indole-3-glycerol phosphate synthase TrpC n=1 Tax=Blastomonas fulva TaxID=1550728 RepID=UPI0025A3CD40|nr:indole-3-glycerol phosphate synthase TrpC [Blastomonas fulva]MDM7929818.1 indole-3-glycerol phosphate synthase TrpC [Blastomonas fulva]MDM7967485.1 indole-3-glycerol phosphate synthase TrpC [Blastomonas fulva]
MNKLEEICSVKRIEVERRKDLTSVVELEKRASDASAPRGFAKALVHASLDGFGLIAEIKRASPSKGLIRTDFDPAAHAAAYQAGGAACLSVLTDVPYFQGHDDFLLAARAACDLPCLRKDFMVDVWQVAESRALGADAVLIIVAALDDATMADIETAALDYGMDVLIEVHDEAELERALKLRSPLIGVNNRDLRSFETDIANTERLVKLIPEGYIPVSESGIDTHDDCVRLSQHGVRTFLVGESLMRQDDITRATRLLLTGSAD